MSKTLIIIQREFATRIKKKSFIILTILMPFIFAALIFVPLWLSTIQDDNQKTVNVVDATGHYAALFQDNESYHFVPQPADSMSFYVSGSGVEAVVVITDDLIKNPRGVVINAPKAVSSDLLRYTEGVLGDQVRRDKLAAYDVPELERIIEDVQSDFSVRTVIKGADGRETASSTSIAMIAGFLFTFLIYMFVMTYGGMVMQSVMEEKTNRIVELMVSSVKPFQLMMGKIIGVALVGLVQILIWGVMLTVIVTVCSTLWSPMGAVAAQAPEGIMAAQAAPTAAPSETAEMVAGLLSLPYGEMALMFCLYFVGGYLLYAAFFAAVGASVNAQEDSSQFVMPVVLIMVFGLYAGMYSVENIDGPLAFWASMFPLTSPIVMMVRIPFGVAWWQEALSLGILLATDLAFVWLSGRIYRVGILLYGKKPSLREMLRWVTYK